VCSNLNQNKQQAIFTILQYFFRFPVISKNKMMKVSRVQCSVAQQAHGCTKGAHSKANHKTDPIKSLLGSPAWALLKSRARYTPAPGPDFSVSLETEERFVVAVCNMLVWYSIREATSNIISDK
jgi:hypothetical protein